jgi:hypothetical protein
LEDLSDGKGCICRSSHLALLAPLPLVKDLALDAHIARPVLAVDDEHAAGADCDVVDVGPLSSRPAHVVKGLPAVTLQGVESQRCGGLSDCTPLIHVGDARVALGLLALSSRKLAR